MTEAEFRADIEKRWPGTKLVQGDYMLVANLENLRVTLLDAEVYVLCHCIGVEAHDSDIGSALAGVSVDLDREYEYYVDARRDIEKAMEHDRT